MGDVYGMATVTLIAASSSTYRQSFLKRERVQQFVYRTRSESGLERSYLLSYYGHCEREAEHVVTPRIPWLPFSGSGNSEFFGKDLTHCAWARRGWTFQESFLSPRKIVFGNAEIHFVSHGQAISRGGGNATDIWVPLDQLKTVPQIYVAWIEVMKQYTRFTPASFTVPTDLLPALSGLASRFGDLLPEDVYLAGHWSGDLHASLMWRAEQNIPLELAEYQTGTVEQRLGIVDVVPSWSCLSRGYVLFMIKPKEYATIKSEVKFLDLDRNVGNANKGLGPDNVVTWRRIILEGHVLDLARFSWSADDADHNLCHGSSPDGAGTVITIDDARSGRFTSTLAAKITNADNDAWSFSIHLDDTVLRERQRWAWDSPEKLWRNLKPLNYSYLLLLGSRSAGKRRGAHGLVMVPTNSLDQGCYFRRAGCFETDRFLDWSPKSESLEFLRGVMKIEKVTLI